MANESALLDDPPVDEAPSLRETIEDAVETHDTESAAPVTPAGSKTETPAAPTSTEPASTVAVPAVAPVTTPTPAAPTPAVSTELKAPAQWKPEVREHWKALPLPVQQEILRRESDSMRLIGSVGPKIRMADDIRGHLEPFRESLEQSGTTFPSFVADVFGTIRTLKDGSPIDKAETLANIIQAYGVDVKSLDAVLSKRLSAPPEVVEARRLAARAQSVLNEQKGRVEYQTAMEAEKSVAVFGADPKHEFIEQVRDMMADLIEIGKAKSLDDAYAAAVWANPETRKILLQREAQSRANAKNSRANAARRASSSVHGAPTAGSRVATTGAAEGESLRATIEAAFDDASSL